MPRARPPYKWSGTRLEYNEPNFLDWPMIIDAEPKGRWIDAICPKCNKACMYWSNNKNKSHLHIGCGGIIFS